MADTGQTSSTVSTNYIDPTLQPYYAGLAATAQGLAGQEYQPYTSSTGQPLSRVAEFDPYQTQAFTGIANLQSPTGYGQAQGLYGQAGNFQAGQFGPAQQLGGANFSEAGTFGQAQAQQYMNPYMMGVTNVAARKMQEEAARNIALGGLKSASLGGYGGSANAINAAAVNRALTTGIGDLYAKNLSDAYLNAQQQYERDRAARMGQEQAAETARQNIFGANVGAQERAFAANESARQWETQNKINAAQGLGALSGQQQTSDLARLAALEQAGRTRQALAQQKLDINYQDFLNQRDWQRNLLGWASNIIHGLPYATSSTTTTTAPPPSTMNTLAGLAGLGISASKLFGGT